MSDFGVIVACGDQDLQLARGSCASIRYFLGDVAICLLVNGGADTGLLDRTYGVQTIRSADLKDADLRDASQDAGRSSLAMFWEAPWSTFLMLDAGALIWGNVCRHADFDRFDMVVDTQLVDLFPETTTSPIIAAFLGDAELRRSERKRRHVAVRYFDLQQIGDHLPEIDWLSEVDNLFSGGAVFGRRNHLSRDRFLELTELGRTNPGLFSNGNDGILNALVALEDIRLNRVTGLRALVNISDPDRITRDYPIDPIDGPIVGDGAVILQVDGHAKPILDGRVAYSEQMTFFNKRFLSDAGWRDPTSAQVSVGPAARSALPKTKTEARANGQNALDRHARLTLEKGRASLARVRDVETLMASGDGVRSFTSPFTAALVLTALAGEPALRSFGEPSVRYLLETVEPPGLWRFSNTLEPILPLDADDSACALVALWLWGNTEVNFEQALEAILSFAQPDGTCPTWLAAGDSFLPGGENEVDVVVNLNILLLAAMLDRPLPGMTTFVTNFVEENGLSCQNLSLYYTSPFVFAYFLGRWLRYRQGDHLQSLRQRVLWECAALQQQALMNPLDCALAMNCLLDLRSSGETVWNSDITDMVDLLVEEQNETGLWRPVSLFVDPAGNDYGSTHITSAICLEALGKYVRYRAPADGRSAP